MHAADTRDLLPQPKYIKAVAFFMNGLGDAVLALPTLRALAALFEGNLTLICEKGEHDCLFEDVPLARLIPIDAEWSADGRRFDPESVLEHIAGCDIFLSLIPWMSPSLERLLRLLNPRESHGFDPIFDNALVRDYSKHSLDLIFDVVKSVAPNYMVEQFLSPLVLPEQAKSTVTAIKQIIPPSIRLLVVHADTQNEKMWTPESFETALTQILDRFADLLVLIVGYNPTIPIRGRHAARIVPCFGIPFRNACAIVNAADFFLGVDSCMLHVADLSGVPSVGLFAPTLAHEFGFRVAPHISIQARSSMNNIAVEHVVDALSALHACPTRKETRNVEGRRG